MSWLENLVPSILTFLDLDFLDPSKEDIELLMSPSLKGHAREPLRLDKLGIAAQFLWLQLTKWKWLSSLPLKDRIMHQLHRAQLHWRTRPLIYVALFQGIRAIFEIYNVVRHLKNCYA